MRSKLLKHFQQRTAARLVLLEGGSSALPEKLENLHVLAGLDISAETFVTTWVGRPTGILTNLDVTAAHVATMQNAGVSASFLT